MVASSGLATRLSRRPAIHAEHELDWLVLRTGDVDRPEYGILGMP